ncbi:MAG: hypothetical protein J5765_01190 [Clostridia bacterium]|nr:hypothetical protein [Clostridia bacterium]
MKRKLGIIILAMLLCAVLAFTLVACGNKNNDPQTPADPGSSGGLVGVSDKAIADVETNLQAYLDNWVLAHATEASENQRGALTTDLNNSKALYNLKGTEKTYKPTFNVTYNNGTYTVKISWEQGALSKTLTVKESTVKYANWSGKHSRTADYDYLEDEDAITDTLDAIIAAFVNSANKVTANIQTGKFGLDGKLGFDAFGANYALRVKGNVDTSSKPDTELGLVIENGSGKEIAGLYYKGAETAKDSRVYIQYPVTRDNEETYAYKYIEYADILGFVSGLLKDDEGNSIIKETAGDGVFDNDIDGLDALLNSYEVDPTISTMIPGIVKMLAKAYKKGDRYMIDINLADVMGQVSSIISSLGSIDIGFLDDIGLDLSSMNGLRGHISISAEMKTEGNKEYLTDFELAVNIPEDTTFAFSDAADAIKIDLPSIGFAIYFEDFSFVTSGETKIADVVPRDAIVAAREQKGYFSPTNVDLSGDVYVNHVAKDEEKALDSTFHFEFVTDINPLEIIEKGFESEARAALVIRQHSGNVKYEEAKKNEWSNFLSISYEQKTHLLCVSGTAFGLDDGKTVYKYDLYTTEIGEDGKVKDVINMKAIKRWLGLWDEEKNYHGLSYNGSMLNITIANEEKAFESAKAIYGNEVVKELIDYFFAKLDEEEGGDDKGDVGKDGATAEAPDVMGEISKYFDGVKEIYNKLVKDGVIAFETDPFSLSINVTDETVKSVIEAINETFDAGIPTDVKALKDLKLVKVEANTKGYEDIVYIKVAYGDNLYELTFDGSSEESKFVITFKMTLKSKRTYTVVFDATSTDETWTASVDFDIVDDEGVNVDHTRVALSNFHGEWGNDNVSEIEALLAEIKGAAKTGEIFPEDGTGPATALAKGVFGFLSSEKNKSIVTEIGKFIIRQIL